MKYLVRRDVIYFRRKMKQDGKYDTDRTSMAPYTADGRDSTPNRALRNIDNPWTTVGNMILSSGTLFQFRAV